MNRALKLAGVVAVIGALAACSSSSSDAPRAAAPSATSVSSPTPLTPAQAEVAGYPDLGMTQAPEGGQIITTGALSVMAPAGFEAHPEYVSAGTDTVWLGPSMPSTVSADGTTTASMSLTVKSPVVREWDGVIEPGKGDGVKSAYSFSVSGAEFAGVGIEVGSSPANFDAANVEEAAKAAARQTGAISICKIRLLAGGLYYEILVNTDPGETGLEMIRQIAASIKVTA